jgi:heterodisulfide reductase subunit C
VDLAAMNDALRAMSLSAGRVAPGTAVPVFNEIFLKGIRKRGRVYEMGLMAAFKLRTMRLLEDVGKAPLMVLKGKLPLFGPRVCGQAERKAMFRRAAQGGDQ